MNNKKLALNDLHIGMEIVNNSSFSDSIKRRYENVLKSLKITDIKLER